MSLTVTFPHYQDLIALKWQLDHYVGFPTEILKCLHFFIVDDGSKDFVSVYQLVSHYIPFLSIRLFQIMQDIPFNMPLANNIVIRFATTQHILRTDIDHVIPLKTIKYVLKELNTMNMKTYGVFSRKSLEEGTYIQPHMNTHVINKELYKLMRGYDEAYSGHYGHDDSDFLWRLQASGVTSLSLPPAYYIWQRRKIGRAHV